MNIVSSTHGVFRLSLIKLALVLCGLYFLASCQVDKQYSTVNTAILEDIHAALEESSGGAMDANSETNEPPDAVLQALVPGLSLSSAALVPVEERFDFVVREPLEAREFFGLLAEGTQYSVVVHPGVSGSISALDLKNVTIQEALDQVTTLYGYNINRSGSIFQVMPGGLQTRIFKVNYLNVSRNGTSNMTIVAGGILANGQNNNGNNNNGNNNNGNNGFGGNNNNNNNNNNNQNGQNGNNGFGNNVVTNTGGAKISTTSDSDYWNDLEEIITSIISGGGNPNAGNGGGLLGALANNSAGQRAVVVSPQTGMVVVRAYANELEKVAEFLKLSQSALERQVVLEAKILEVELKESFQSGINLSFLSKINSNNVISGEFKFLEGSVDSIGSPLSLSYGARDFDGVIKLLETQGNVQVISSPRITTLNNQKAVFKVGDEQYFLTNSTTTVFGAGDTQNVNQNVNVEPFFSGIALDVTPQISEAGDIILHIHPLLNQVKEDIKLINGAELPLANSTTRESDTVARARNGEVVVISGLMQTRSRGTEAGVPVARDIPVIGNALEQKETETVKTELVILLRAIVDEDDNMKALIKDHEDSFEKLRRQVDPYYR